jgi:ADP-heptose:LPS heptosyltransferase
MIKILILRFSSIGDIVLTSPVIRALHNLPQRPEIHFISKKKFAQTLINNPYLDKIYTFEKEITEILSELKSENYDYIIDLHSNLRSKRLKMALASTSNSFNKLNMRKWLSIKLKYDLLPKIHIVDRYINTISFLGATNDGLGLDYFISDKDRDKTKKLIGSYNKGYHAFVIGGAHFTKQIPTESLIKISNSSTLPIILVGGPEDFDKGEEIIAKSNAEVFNACGKFNLNESASIIEKCNKVVSSDTGMMHIASAFQKPILSIWGNTVPEFGMYPYFAHDKKDNNHIFEVKGLSCRPCSKIGYKECPKKHFKCMFQIDLGQLIKVLNS